MGKTYGYSLEEQLGTTKKKKEPTFGKTPSPWRKDGETPPKKVKRNDNIDSDYLHWLCTQPCVITGRGAERGAGADNMHAHHIDGRNRGTNDYEAVPLLGAVHSWGMGSYHSSADSDFKKKWIPTYKGTVKHFFKQQAKQLRERYLDSGGIILEKA